MQDTTTLTEVFDLARRLSPRDKIRLIGYMASEIERDLLSGHPKPRKSLWGRWANLGLAPAAEEIDEARFVLEMMGAWNIQDQAFRHWLAEEASLYDGRTSAA